MNKAKKYKLKLDYTADELKALRILGEYDSPMYAVNQIVQAKVCNNPFISLWRKYRTMEYEDEFDFVADINNAVKGTAIFPDKKYVVHDSVTDRYVCFNALAETFCWSSVQSRIPEMKTKKEWLKINPAYETMLERVEDDE